METLAFKGRRPTHPGALIREDVLPELGLTQAELAEQLGVSRRTISEIIHERRPVTPDMALRLGKFCGNGPRLWLNMQQALDLWELEHLKAKEYGKIRKCA
ncbi:MAG: HigA family addiction module antitoxin [Gammaproteobacteria bacterium]|nr:HigA family addiction module antitoxin [Gammaproteobacteria bacterium]